MRTKAIATVLLFAGVGALVAQGPEDVIRAVRRFQTAEGASMEGVGVCALGEISVECWDMDGKPNADLVEKVRAHYLTQPNDSIRLSYRKKNRLLVARHRRGTSGDSGISLNSRVSDLVDEAFSINQDKEALYFYRYVAAPKDKDATIPLTIYLPEEAPLRLKTEKGSRAQNTRNTAEFIGTEPGPKPSAGTDMDGPGSPLARGASWILNLGWTVESNTSDAPIMSLQAKDAKGNFVFWVDERGKPVEESTAREYFVQMRQDRSQSRSLKLRPAMVSLTTSPTQGRLRCQTNIDPQYIKILQISQTRSQSIELSGFPLDPTR